MKKQPSEYDIWLADNDPNRWTRYNKMMKGREVVNFNRTGFCKKCGRRWGDHLSDIALENNPNACRFEA